MKYLVFQIENKGLMSDRNGIYVYIPYSAQYKAVPEYKVTPSLGLGCFVEKLGTCKNGIKKYKRQRSVPHYK
jgi:hypothetical protein